MDRRRMVLITRKISASEIFNLRNEGGFTDIEPYIFLPLPESFTYGPPDPGRKQHCHLFLKFNVGTGISKKNIRKTSLG